MAASPFPKAYWKGYLDVRQVNPVDEPAEPSPIIPGVAARDAFGRLRVSEPTTLFDSKLLYDKAPLFWDEQITNVSGNASATFDRASVLMHVESGDEVVRQTRMRFNYEPGKSQLILITGVMASGSGVISRLGAFNAQYGLLFEYDDGVYSVGIRNDGVDVMIPRSEWDDPMDGTGPSKVNVDLTKAQIFVIDYEWLGVGAVRFGFFANGEFFLAHTVTNFNVLEVPYTATPNYHIRHEVSTTGDTAEARQICSSVVSEAGQQLNGYTLSVPTENISTLAPTASTIYACVGVRAQTIRKDIIHIVERLSVINVDSADFEWMLLFNPTVAGTFTYSAVPGTGVERAVGDSTNTIVQDAWELTMTAGYAVGSNQAGGKISEAAPNALRLGERIDGTQDEIVLACRPLGANNAAEFYASMTIRELI